VNLDKKRKMVALWLGTKRIFFLFLLTTIFYWLLESLVDTYFWKKGGNYWDNFLPLHNYDEIWMRAWFITLSLVLFCVVFYLTNFILVLMKEEKRDKEKISKNNEKIKEFTKSVLHDFKSPCIALEGLTGRLEKNFTEQLGKEGSVICQYLLQVARNMKRLTGLLEEYIETQGIAEKIEKVDVNSVLNNVAGEFSVRMIERNIKFLRPKVPIKIKTDRNSLIRIFRNLVDNSLKYGGKELSEIKILFEDKKDSYVFSVIDNGQGIEQENSDLIFERYETASDNGGTGLGLAIVKELAEKQDGTAWVNTDYPGGGTCICFSIGIYF